MSVMGRKPLPSGPTAIGHNRPLRRAYPYVRNGRKAAIIDPQRRVNFMNKHIIGHHSTEGADTKVWEGFELRPTTCQGGLARPSPRLRFARLLKQASRFETMLNRRRFKLLVHRRDTSLQPRQKMRRPVR